MRPAQKLVEHYKTRGRTADALGVTRETIRLWLNHGIPLERALYVEKKSRGVVTAQEVLDDARAAV